MKKLVRVKVEVGRMGSVKSAVVSSVKRVWGRVAPGHL